jgi:hypothetical protein
MKGDKEIQEEGKCSNPKRPRRSHHYRKPTQRNTRVDVEAMQNTRDYHNIFLEDIKKKLDKMEKKVGEKTRETPTS